MPITLSDRLVLKLKRIQDIVFKEGFNVIENTKIWIKFIIPTVYQIHIYDPDTLVYLQELNPGELTISYECFNSEQQEIELMDLIEKHINYLTSYAKTLDC
jgi:hypothetical protein